MERHVFPTLSIVYEAQPSGLQDPVLANSAGPLLNLALAQTHSQGAYVYRLRREEPAGLHLAIWSGLRPSAIGRFQVQVAGRKADWYFALDAPVLVNENGWTDWRFQDFPEFLHNRFEAVVAIPLLDQGQVIGVAHFVRRDRKPYGPGESSFLRQLGQPLGSLLAGALARTELQTELERISRKLEERKVVERAKGLIQERFAWTEQEAYQYLRINSRRRRIPMGALAGELIEVTHLVAPEKADAAD